MKRIKASCAQPVYEISNCHDMAISQAEFYKYAEIKPSPIDLRPHSYDGGLDDRIEFESAIAAIDIQPVAFKTKLLPKNYFAEEPSHSSNLFARGDGTISVKSNRRLYLDSSPDSVYRGTLLYKEQLEFK